MEHDSEIGNYMKRLITSATNSVNIPAKVGVTAADDDEITLDDRIKQVSEDIDYVLDGITKLDYQSANSILVDIENDVQSFIQQVAEKLS